ncbi:hypothetical protein L1987_33976 [Smallanthus sonchifolius]|uniref:Uncharacterized protein n=1 Tax=Smallanthus sonchifolius TaxID=185202 RepID=A0ACB9HRU3_9ASTR|nr:hypothetical protein L1987_33976 [Smallanthus sonchifolius]
MHSNLHRQIYVYAPSSLSSLILLHSILILQKFSKCRPLDEHCTEASEEQRLGNNMNLAHEVTHTSKSSSNEYLLLEEKVSIWEEKQKGFKMQLHL